MTRSGLEPGQPVPSSEPLDRLTSLVAKVLRVPLALVSLVSHERQAFLGMHGTLPQPFHLRETPLSHSFCQHVVTTAQPLIIHDALIDERVRDNPAIRDLSVAAYMGVPLITSDGQVLGSLCAIDTVPRHWADDDVEMLRGLAGFATTELELRRSGSKVADLRAHDHPPGGSSQESDLQLLVHDLRTPLNSLMLGLQTVPLLGDLNEDQREALEIAGRGGQALVALVDDILELGAAESILRGGKMELSRSSVAPEEVLQSAGRQVGALARERDIRFLVDASDSEQFALRMEADRDKLVRALVNLLGNAVKFTPDHGTVSAKVRQSADRQEIMFTVQDTGRGIAKADFARIFERFVRIGGDGHGSGGRSTGVGLAFCKLVADAHGGSIAVESTVGQGSTFTLRLPAREQHRIGF